MVKIASVLLKPLQSLLGTLQKERHFKDNQMDEALLAINNALVESKKYIEIFKRKDNVDREKEYELARLWSEASVKARHASKELAKRLNDKSKYWSETIKWSREEVISKKIDFYSIEKQIRKLLKNS